MNTRLTMLTTLLACAAGVTLATPALGQVVRESDVRSLAGVLDPVMNPADEFTFASAGQEVLFADLDSEIFQVKGRRGGDHGEDHESHDTTLVASSSGTTHDDGSTHEEGDGCGGSSGGPGGLCLQVIDATGTMICWADRPLRPGWQRDPAIACPLPRYGSRPSQYTLRVSLKSGGCGPGGSGGHDHETAVATASAPTGGDVTPYVLNWSLRRVAQDGRLANQAARQD